MGLGQWLDQMLGRFLVSARSVDASTRISWITFDPSTLELASRLSKSREPASSFVPADRSPSVNWGSDSIKPGQTAASLEHPSAASPLHPLALSLPAPAALRLLSVSFSICKQPIRTTHGHLQSLNLEDSSLALVEPPSSTELLFLDIGSPPSAWSGCRLKNARSSQPHSLPLHTLVHPLA